MTSLTWSHVVDRPTERLEFGACHVNQAWRRHKTPQSKFLGLNAAFATSNHRLPLLLQAVDANYNARNHPERGQALFASVWFQNSPWAILCDPTHATIVTREVMEQVPEQKTRNDETVMALRLLFNATPVNIREPLDDTFFSRVICRQ